MEVAGARVAVDELVVPDDAEGEVEPAAELGAGVSHAGLQPSRATMIVVIVKMVRMNRRGRQPLGVSAPGTRPWIVPESLRGPLTHSRASTAAGCHVADPPVHENPRISGHPKPVHMP